MLQALPAVAADKTVSTDTKTGDEYFSTGNYSNAIKHWQTALSQFEQANNQQGQAQVLQRIANAYQEMGNLSQALESLHKASHHAGKTTDKILQTYITANLASLHMAQGNNKLAHKLFEQSVFRAKSLGDDKLHAAVLNDFGSLLVQEGFLDGAKSRFYQSKKISRKANLSDQEIRVLINLAIIEVLNHEHKTFLGYILQATEIIDRRAVDYNHAVYALRMSELLLSMGHTKSDMRKNQFKIAHALLGTAHQHLKSIDARRDMSMAQGLFGDLYLATGNLQPVEKFYRRAIFLAQESSANDLLYRWQWQYARYLRDQGNIKKSLAMFRQARASYTRLNPLFTWTNADPGTRDDTPSVFHYELADLLLKYSNTINNKREMTALLKEARDTIEGLKSTELQDYFRDSCVTRTRKKIANIGNSIEHDTAILYPILFKDRLEILVSHGNEISRYTTQVTANKVKASIAEFRTQLEKRRTRDYLSLASQFHDWIIKPISDLLVKQEIKTLVLIPDVTMRSLPFAALHDGERFLIEKYALVASPGLELTDRKKSSRDNISVLLGGLTESVDGLPALSHVGKELDSINKLFPGEILLNDEFRKQPLKSKLSEQQFSVVHVASHGKFTGNVNQSYLVTYDGKMTVNELAQSIGASRFRAQPIELLTLSACNTAAGDEKAALGLAGITVKAGARSALATLWPVNDVATAELMAEFYRELKDESLNKAQVLQKAQLRMLNDKRYRHPGYWAPFLLIGNWL